MSTYDGYQPMSRIEFAPDANARIWTPVRDALDGLHELHAPGDFLAAKRRVLGPDCAEIPQPARISDLLYRVTGFRLEKAGGLVEPRAFFKRLALGIFSSTTFLRPCETPHFAPEPDWIHELLGHAVMLSDRRVAALYRKFGAAATAARTEHQLRQVERLYWYSAETGVVRERTGRKAFGAALLSSAAELRTLPWVEARPFDPEVMQETPYDETRAQTFVFEAPSLATLLHALGAHLDRMIASYQCRGHELDPLSTSPAYPYEVSAVSA